MSRIPVVPPKGSLVEILSNRAATGLPPALDATPRHLTQRAKPKGKGPQDWMPAVVENAAAKVGVLQPIADMIGVSKRTLELWLAAGASDNCKDELLIELHAAYIRGRATFSGELWDQARHHAGENAGYNKWLLTALNPELNVATKSEHKQASVTVTTAAVKRLEDMSEEELELEYEDELKRLNQ